MQEGLRRPLSDLELEAADTRRLSPEEEYRRRLQAREARVAELTQRRERIGNGRLLVAAVGAVAAWLSLVNHAFPAIYLWLPVPIFAGLVVWYSAVERARAHAWRAVSFYRQGLARVEDRWDEQGSAGERFDDPHHVYASDLDLFGPGSLFQLLCIARTRMGEETLARWLLAPASVEEVRQRHAAVAELADRVDLREELAVLGEEGTGVHPDRLLSWAETPNELQHPWIKAAAVVLAALALATVILWGATGLAWPFLLVLIVEICVLRVLHGPIEKGLIGSEQAFENLRLFAALLTRLEREPFASARLTTLRARLAAGSAAIGRLATIANLAGSRRNQLMALLAVPLMYPLAVALMGEHWRSQNGPRVRNWIEGLGELEALICLAGYRYEHPADCFPELCEGPASFEGRQLGHPLLPARRCVRNDVSLSGPARLLLVSGSNMSGKSTLLRTVGINTVLAMAGAPVRAARLQLTPLQVGASIRVNDSLHEGSSRFYAEITRLRQLLDCADGPIPLLYLLDELLMGTNSKDRQIGATGILKKGFMARGALGLVSTHDLALTHIDGLPAAALRNVHFQDELRNGQMSFDFRLRDGVVEKSNGVELMRLVGLDV